MIPSSLAVGELVLQRLYKKSQNAVLNEFGAAITTWTCSVNKNCFGHTNSMSKSNQCHGVGRITMDYKL